jgi:hypothetical protein
MKKISSLVGSVIGSHSKLIAINLILQKAWNEIAGETLLDVSSFAYAKFTGKNELSIHIKTLSSALILAKFESERIINKIKQLIEISHIKLTFKPVCSIQKEIKDIKIIPSSLAKEKLTLDLQLENKQLKTALETLKTEMQNAA